MFRLHRRPRRLGGLASLALAAAMIVPVGAVAAATSISLHAPHVGTAADCGASGILWHFVLNQLDPGTPSGTLSATFATAGVQSDAGEPVGKGRVQHFWIATETGDTVLGASASVADQSGSPSLVLSHWECGDVAPGTPASNPPGDVGGSSGAVREGTLGSSGGPGAAVLPDTATGVATVSALLLAGLVLLGGATLVAVTVAARSRRR